MDKVKGGRIEKPKRQNSFPGKISTQKGVSENLGPEVKSKPDLVRKQGKIQKRVSSADEAGAEEASATGFAGEQEDVEEQNEDEAAQQGGKAQDDEIEDEVQKADGRRKSSTKGKRRGWNNPFIAR